MDDAYLRGERSGPPGRGAEGKRASRVVELLLSEDCVAASRAAKCSGLTDRAARRLFDRLVELEAVREVSGRTAFRLYGL